MFIQACISMVLIQGSLTLTQGFYLKTSNRTDLLARLACDDANTPGFDGFAVEWQVSDVTFEADTYQLLLEEPDLMTSRLLYYRAPVQYSGLRTNTPLDLSGRRLLIRASGREEQCVA